MRLCVRRYHAHPKFLPFPAKHISLRGGEEEKYSAIDMTRAGKPGGHPQILEEVEVSRALFELYEGAVVSVCVFPRSLCPIPDSCAVHTPRVDIPCASILRVGFVLCSLLRPGERDQPRLQNGKAD